MTSRAVSSAGWPRLVANRTSGALPIPNGEVQPVVPSEVDAGDDVSYLR